MNGSTQRTPEPTRTDSRLLTPARAVLDRLKYPQKFALISLLFILPLGVVMTLLFSEVNDRINFARAEIGGARYLRPLRALQEHAGQGRFLAAAHGDGNTTLRPDLIRKQAQIDEDFVTLEQVEKDLGAGLNTAQKLAALKENWRFLKGQTLGLQAGDVDSLHEKLGIEIRELMAHVGDSSNLILDPDLDTYYLMDTMLLKLPEGADLLAQVRLLGRGIAQRKAATPEERAEATRLAGLLQSNLEQTRAGVGLAFKSNPAQDLKLRMGDALQSYDATLSDYLAALRKETIQVPIGTTAATAGADVLIQRALAANAGLWERDTAELVRLLKARIDNFAHKERLIAAIACVALLAVLYVWLAFYSSMMRTVNRLRDASERMVGGAIDQQLVTLETRDELGQVVTSFNNVAIRLRQEWKQAQDESRRAREAELQLLEHEKELVRARDAAEDANRAKSQFLANMSHELRTPLNAIIGYSEMLQEASEDVGQEDFIPDLKKIHGAGKHLLHLINDILDLSKIEAGKMSLFVESFDVGNLVQEVATTVHPLIQNNANLMEVQMGDALGSMNSDVTKVRQCLFNLLSNASKFTEKGVIRLRVSREASAGGDMLQFEVSDSGVGISREQLAKLFQAFSQADASTTRKYGGTGLGLALTRRFCQMMGGDVVVTSDVGKGSTFTIRLPADAPAPVQAAPAGAGLAAGVAERTVPVPSRDGRDTILVVDDEASARDLMTHHLVREGFHVVTASNGQEALQLARQIRPSAVTLDVMMPGMDGWAVLTALKKDTELCDIPVLMCTMLDDRNMALSLGASEFLDKPIDRDRLKRVLRRYSNGSKRGRVLLVEDDAGTREMMARVLDKEGWIVAEAENGRVALQSVARERPDLILLDLMMPEMDGFAFAQELRSVEAHRSIPIIVLTAKELTAEDHRRLNGHVTSILQKGAQSSAELGREMRDVLNSTLRAQKASTP